MLTLHSCNQGTDSTVAADIGSDVVPDGVVWMDLHDGDPAEIAYVERVTRLHVPNRAELSEIERQNNAAANDRGRLDLSV